MKSTLIALPLSSGEAFLLRTVDKTGRNWTILVDGGKKYGENSRELARLLADIKPDIAHIDIVLCTHSDADHSQGLWNLPQDWYGMGRTIGEFWLPGRWANAMPRILTDPAGFAADLAEGSIDLGQFLIENGVGGENLTEMRAVSREQRLRHLVDEMSNGRLSELLTSAVTMVVDSENSRSDDDGAAAFGLNADELRSLRLSLDESDDRTDPLIAATYSIHVSYFRFPAWFYRRERFFDLPLAIRLESQIILSEVAETAKAIRKIATAALSHRIGIRWFDFGEYAKSEVPSGGVLGLLEPWCSVEVLPDRSKLSRLSALALVTNLRLTQQNVESLVFYRPETDQCPGVLFLGDSRLAYGIEKPERDFRIPFPSPSRNLLVTAPHHGSDHNDNAYEVVDRWASASKILLVRNGGQSNQKLAEYLRRNERRCAQCVQCHGKKWNQWVAVTATGNVWNWPPNANPCGSPKI